METISQWMSAWWWPLVVLLVCICCIVALIARLKLHAFFALMIVAVLAGVMAAPGELWLALLLMEST